MIKNPHAYPLVMFMEGLEHCINELENARTTIAEDAIYIKRLEEQLDEPEVIDDPFSWRGFDE